MYFIIISFFLIFFNFFANIKMIWPYRLTRFRTPGFHPDNTGSNPVGAAWTTSILLGPKTSKIKKREFSIVFSKFYLAVFLGERWEVPLFYLGWPQSWWLFLLLPLISTGCSAFSICLFIKSLLGSK